VPPLSGVRPKHGAARVLDHQQRGRVAGRLAQQRVEAGAVAGGAVEEVPLGGLVDGGEGGCGAGGWMRIGGGEGGSE